MKSVQEFVPYSRSFYDPETVKPADQAMIKQLWDLSIETIEKSMTRLGRYDSARVTYPTVEKEVVLKSPDPKHGGMIADVWLFSDYDSGTPNKVEIITSNDNMRNSVRFSIWNEESGYTLAKSIFERDGKLEASPDYNDPVAKMVLSGVKKNTKVARNQKNIDELLSLQGRSNVPQAEAEALFSFMKQLSQPSRG